MTGFALRRQKSGVERSKAGVGTPTPGLSISFPFLRKEENPAPPKDSAESSGILSKVSVPIVLPLHSKACVLAASAAPGGMRRLRAARPPPSWLKCWWVSQRFLPQAVVSQCPGFLSHSISRTGFRYCYKVSGLLLPAQTSQAPTRFAGVAEAD